MDRRERNCGTLNARRNEGEGRKNFDNLQEKEAAWGNEGKEERTWTTFRKRKPPRAMRGRKKELGQPSGKGSRLGQ